MRLPGKWYNVVHCGGAPFRIQGASGLLLIQRFVMGLLFMLHIGSLGLDVHVRKTFILHSANDKEWAGSDWVSAWCEIYDKGWVGTDWMFRSIGTS